MVFLPALQSNSKSDFSDNQLWKPTLSQRPLTTVSWIALFLPKTIPVCYDRRAGSRDSSSRRYCDRGGHTSCSLPSIFYPSIELKPEPSARELLVFDDAFRRGCTLYTELTTVVDYWTYQYPSEP